MTLWRYPVRLRLLAATLLPMVLFSFSGCDTKKENNAGAEVGKTSKTGGPKRIVLLNNTDSPFWDAARAGIAKAVEDLKLSDAGYTAGMDSNDGTEPGQIEKLRQYGTQDDIVAVVISPVSGTNPAIADELKKLKDKGIIVGCFDSDLDKNFMTAATSMSAPTISPEAKSWGRLPRTSSQRVANTFNSSASEANRMRSNAWTDSLRPSVKSSFKKTES